ncbi:alpha-L-rhamnosidase [Mucilaginibacter sp. PPCGB 2223]|uniref:family 78 glycoside hydrolase catalytic domain n=1 Tax=Mucilaginibacter sp. PPCGB 2223 TaxID=1886027 RepID=UPI000826C7C3|nr:family 78 glycoside hydrolase catalytic domain [Mucilaginibacter sp. PPCGB 2223]OCX53298.1 alpha-L-rhamnosidase [Mucilaginibacter sp. PPCGB 2223]
MRKYLFVILVSGALSPVFSQVKVVNPRCEYKIDPIIETLTPHLSWELQSDSRGVVQTAYRLLVADNAASLEKNIGNIWDSKKVLSPASIQVKYSGMKLLSAKKYYWKVMVWDNKAHASPWSTVAGWQMGLLTADDWKGAKWIAYETMPDSNRILPGITPRGGKKISPGKDILPIFRKRFNVNKTVKSATLFISGLGHFEASLNGEKIGDHFMDAGWTNYQKQALYVGFDITRQLQPGQNAIGVMLGNGFYFTPSGRYRKLTVAYGYPKMICRLLIEYADGTSSDIISDPSWNVAPGPITFSAMYGGEDYDATLEQKGWDTPVFDDRQWRPAIITEGPGQLNMQMEEPVKVMQSFSAKSITKIKDAEYVYDLGQNSSAIPQITVKGKRGDTIIITPAELVNADGTANQKATGRHTYKYTLKGDGEETWSPRFTYYGLRYLQIDGTPQIISVKGLHIRNGADKAGEFSCSNDLFNKTNTLIDWAVKSNMVSVFTDCPHRERLGWLEQDHLMGNSLQYNYDLVNLFKKCVNDMRFAQTPDGLIPEIAPEFTVFGDGFRDSPEWGSAAILVPWYVYQWYGDKQVLADSYEMMQRYLTYLDKLSDRGILTEGLGDWFDLGPRRPGVSQLTSKGVTATAMFYYDLTTTSKIAAVLNKPADAAYYTSLAVKVRTAFNVKFFNKETKQYDTGSQTANAVAVYMKLVEPQYKKAVVENIVKDIRDHNNSFTAGDIGFRYLLKVLDDEGRSDVIFDMNNRSDVPGYGYQLAKGATALTESWQALPSVSNNHFMLGHIMEWFYTGLAGIRPDDNAVAYQQIVIRPEPVGDVTSAKGSYHSVYGTITSEWKKTTDSFDLSVTIPANTTATIYLPAKIGSKIMEGDKTPISKVSIVNNKAIINIGSGAYHFKVTD